MTDSNGTADIDLLVVGGGPTGIAALFEAALLGIPAVGLEAGRGAGESLRHYLNGLVLISRPTDYEVAGIPLDCRDPNQLTREEVLHYLGRVVNYGRLDVRAGEPCLELTPAAEAGGPVLVRTPLRLWRARHVVVTGWYRRRLPPAALTEGAEGVLVIESLRDGIEVAGRATVVLGGGLSAFEQATAVMMHGQGVTIVSRHPLPAAFRTPHFTALVRATCSRVVEGAADIRLGRRCLSCTQGEGGQQTIPCEALVLCLGQELDEDLLGLLARAGVVSDQEIAQVRSSPTPDSMIRHGRTVADAINAALQAWPDFRTRLIGGVNGVRLAGGGLHIGGAHSGVKVSIQTAAVAVRDIAGLPLPDYLSARVRGGDLLPLPLALAQFVQRPPQEAPPPVLGALRPLRITSWTRTTMALRSRDSFEAQPQPVSAPAGAAAAPYLLARFPDDAGAARIMTRILAMSDGTNSVAAIARAVGDGSAAGVRRIAGPLRFLWQNNELTWLPPNEGLPARAPG